MTRFRNPTERRRAEKQLQAMREEPTQAPTVGWGLDGGEQKVERKVEQEPRSYYADLMLYLLEKWKRESEIFMEAFYAEPIKEPVTIWFDEAPVFIGWDIAQGEDRIFSFTLMDDPKSWEVRGARPPIPSTLPPKLIDWRAPAAAALPIAREWTGRVIDKIEELQPLISDQPYYTQLNKKDGIK